MMRNGIKPKTLRYSDVNISTIHPPYLLQKMHDILMISLKFKVSQENTCLLRNTEMKHDVMCRYMGT